MNKVIVITGTPGVGKTTISKMLSKRLVGSRLYDANSIAKNHKLYLGKDKFGSKIVKIKGLEREIGKIVKSNRRHTLIFEGHLLCDIKVPGAVAIVLREHLETIRKRLIERRYPTEKIRDNVVSEAIDYCGASAQKNYAKTYELMSGKNSITAMVQIANGKFKRKNRQIDLLHELLHVIKKEREFAL
ncbi:MAG: AAA family ATPase [Candidatus Micrarchaeota archaeon]|nr:AAA family ATPase [Candidatus Micrarchaeota archaeon]